MVWALVAAIGLAAACGFPVHAGEAPADNGQQCAADPLASLTELGAPIPVPLGFRQIDLGGYAWWQGREPGQLVWERRGLNSFALYVRIWGRVVSHDTANLFIYVDDGSRRTDYLKSRVGVRVELPSGSTFPADGDFVIVTGISSTYADPTTADPLPKIWTRDPSDIQLPEH
jgi:hypothetical protein